MKGRELLRPLRAPGSGRVWCGQAVNVIGDAVYTVAVALFLVPRHDVATALGVVLGVAAAGGLLSMLIGGALADRHRRARMIIVSDVLRGGGVLGLVVVGPHAPLAALAALAAVLGIGSGLYRPAYSAILPSLVPDELLASANSLRALINRFGIIIGAAIGGLLAAGTSPRWALALDVVTFAVSILTLLRFAEEPRGDRVDRSSLGAEIRSGFAYVRRRPWMSAIMLQGTVQMALVAAPVAVLLPILTGPAGWFGWITAAEAFGAFLGALYASAARTGSPGWLAMFALLAQLPQLVLLATSAAPWSIAIATVATGAGLSLFAVVWTTALQTGVPRGQLGRVFSLDQLSGAGLLPVGFLLAGWLFGRIGATALAWLSAAVLLASVLAVLPFPGLRELRDDAASARKIGQRARPN